MCDWISRKSVSSRNLLNGYGGESHSQLSKVKGPVSDLRCINLLTEMKLLLHINNMLKTNTKVFLSKSPFFFLASGKKMIKHTLDRIWYVVVVNGNLATDLATKAEILG